VNLTPMRVLAREYDLLDDKRRITVELANGRVLTFRVAGDDARFFDDVSERDVVQALRPLVPEEWAMTSDDTKVL
jgi:hypothetical protein